MNKTLIILFSFLFTLSLYSAPPIPYSGKIDIRGGMESMRRLPITP